MKRKVILAATLALSLQAKEVNLEVILSLSGATAAYGRSALEDIKLADEMQSTLANGDRISLTVLDTKGDKTKSVSTATHLVNQDKVLGLISEMVTANTLQVIRIAEENKIPLIAPATAGDKLLRNKLYSSRACFMNSFQGSSLAKYVFEKLSHKKTVIMVDQSTDYSLGLAKAFKKEFKAKGGEILETLRVNSGDKDFRATATQIKILNPGFIFLPLYYSEASLFVRQAKLIGLNTPIGSADGVTGATFTKLAGDASERYIFTDSFDTNNPTTQLGRDFVAKYARENQSKGVPNFIAMGANAYFVMFSAMNTCQNTLTSECINEKTRQTDNYEGVSGVISIGKSRNVTRPVAVKEVRNQKQTYKDTINP